MEEKSTYINVLIMSLKKKITILEKVEKTVSTEGDLLKNSNTTVDQLSLIDDEKVEQLAELDKVDEGFQRVYERVKEEFADNKYKYEEEIKIMQGLIKTISDFTAKIQAQEIRNKQLMDLYIQRKKQEVRAFKVNHRSASTYTSHLADRTSGQSYFFDGRK